MALRLLPLALRRRLWLGLVWALVLAPTLGQMHRVLHGSGPAGRLHVAASGDPAAFSVEALFTGHHSSDCQLLDQLTLADAPPGASAALAHNPPHALPTASAQTPPGLRRMAPFQARAPPAQAVNLLRS